MISGLKKSIEIYGLSDGIIMAFRYLWFILNTNKDGIYYLKPDDMKLEKFKNAIVFSDKLLKNNPKILKTVTELNNQGYKVNYIYLGKDKLEKLNKYNPFCYYKSIDKYDFKKNISEKDLIIMDCDISHNKDIYNYIISINKNVLNFKIADNMLSKIDNPIKEQFYGNISIIVLNYNNKEIIFKCLNSLIDFNKYKYEIIVVDNGSVDGSYEEIKKNYPNIRLFKNTKNGCSSGRNLGVKNSNKDYIMFLDSDQIVTNSNWLDNYLDILDINSNIGAIGWTGGWFNRKGYSHLTVECFPNRYISPNILCRKDIGYLGTGGMIIKRDTFNKIEGFDQNYDPTCYEDTDISLKIRNIDMELVYCPYLGIIHKAHQTTKSGSENHKKLIEEKGKYFVDKWKRINKKLLRYVK